LLHRYITLLQLAIIVTEQKRCICRVRQRPSKIISRSRPPNFQHSAAFHFIAQES